MDANKISMLSMFSTKSIMLFSRVSIEISIRLSRSLELEKKRLFFLTDLKPMPPSVFFPSPIPSLSRIQRQQSLQQFSSAALAYALARLNFVSFQSPVGIDRILCRARKYLFSASSPSWL